MAADSRWHVLLHPAEGIAAIKSWSTYIQFAAMRYHWGHEGGAAPRLVFAECRYLNGFVCIIALQDYSTMSFS